MDAPESPPSASSGSSSGSTGSAPSDPGIPRPARWYHLQDGDERHGPVALVAMRELVAERVVTAQTLVWSDGMRDWTPARDVPALVPPEPLRQHLGWPAGSSDAGRWTTW